MVGASLADDEGVRNEQRALIDSIEHSLGQLRSQNSNLHISLLNAQSTLSFYDEVLTEVGQALIGSRLLGKNVAFFVEGPLESSAQELRSHLRNHGIEVRTVVWMPSNNGEASGRSLGSAALSTTHVQGIMDLLAGAGTSPVLEPLISDGRLRVTGSTGPADCVVLMVAGPNEVALQLATLTKERNHGLIASTGTLNDENMRPYKSAGWSVIPHIETPAGRLSFVSQLLQKLD